MATARLLDGHTGGSAYHFFLDDNNKVTKIRDVK